MLQSPPLTEQRNHGRTLRRDVDDGPSVRRERPQSSELDSYVQMLVFQELKLFFTSPSTFLLWYTTRGVHRVEHFARLMVFKKLIQAQMRFRFRAQDRNAGLVQVKCRPELLV